MVFRFLGRTGEQSASINNFNNIYLLLLILNEIMMKQAKITNSSMKTASDVLAAVSMMSGNCQYYIMLSNNTINRE